MSYSIPIKIKAFSKNKGTFKDFIKKITAKDNAMIFLSENCYTWLKNTSIFFEEKNTKVFRQCYNEEKVYIETINIDSSNCSLLKSILCNNYYHEYLNGIPQEIFLVILDGEDVNCYNKIFACAIEPDVYECPVTCIIDYPNIFKNSIVFLNVDSYQRLKRNTNTISNLYDLERLTWNSDEIYPGGTIMLHTLSFDRLYMLCSMNFPFFSKDFSFNLVPQAIYFIK